MNDPEIDLVTELLRSAKNVEKLHDIERVILLRQAATEIQVLRDQINFSEASANDPESPEEIIYCLKQAALMIEDFTAHEISETLVKAAEVIKAARVLHAAKMEIET